MVVPQEVPPTRPARWWRDPVVLGGGLILAALLISAGVEQATGGRLATPDWLVTLTQTAIGAAVTSGLIGEAGRIAGRQRARDGDTGPEPVNVDREGGQ